ncbi:hypothetical protein ACLOJK_005031 [Asimina triloba]
MSSNPRKLEPGFLKFSAFPAAPLSQPRICLALAAATPAPRRRPLLCRRLPPFLLPSLFLPPCFPCSDPILPLPLSLFLPPCFPCSDPILPSLIILSATPRFQRVLPSPVILSIVAGSQRFPASGKPLTPSNTFHG